MKLHQYIYDYIEHEKQNNWGMTPETIKNAIEAYESVENAEILIKKDGFDQYNRLQSAWDVDDVLGQAEDLDIDITNEQALEILKKVRKYHNAEVGINWDVISVYIQATG